MDMQLLFILALLQGVISIPNPQPDVNVDAIVKIGAEVGGDSHGKPEVEAGSDGTFTFAGNNVTCPDQMKNIGGCCYLFSNEQGLANKNWPKAKAQCQRMGSRKGLNWNLAEAGTVPCCGPMQLMEYVGPTRIIYWFGATDTTTEGHWIWQQTNKVFPVTSNMWGYDEPNNVGDADVPPITGAHGEDCLAVEFNKASPTHVSRAYFNDRECTASLPYICQNFPLKSLYK